MREHPSLVLGSLRESFFSTPYFSNIGVLLEIVILVVLTFVITLLIWLLRKQSRALIAQNKLESSSDKIKPEKEKNPLSVCLLCGEDLPKGETLRTALYPSDGKEGRPLEIIGCSRCAPKAPKLRAPGITPKCPVCKSSLKKGQVVYARRIEQEGKNQVNVLGCPHCKKPDIYR